MKTCNHCGKTNPGNASYCYQCGNTVKYVTASVIRKSFWSRLPSWAWIFIGVGGIGLFILLIIGSFYSLAHWEGFASIIFLVLGVFAFRVFSGQPPSNIPVIRAIAIGFFALMGATIDQPGNLIYNKPVETCLCPTGSQLQRSTITTNPLPGRTDMTQDFTCVLDGKPVESINMLAVMGIRFLEYLVLGYLLIGLRWLFWLYKKGRLLVAA
ncbi:MAG: zinc ribbon domain-containing protein [Chitinophagaceae bacterium]|nr:MAG: zinc ribbon domain-containing protein [Chitinophagaceae bacterium]